mgnify:CR=1 FL=1
MSESAVWSLPVSTVGSLYWLVSSARRLFDADDDLSLLYGAATVSELSLDETKGEGSASVGRELQSQNERVSVRQRPRGKVATLAYLMD